MTTPTPRVGGRSAGVAAGWPVPAGLIALSLIPLAALVVAGSALWITLTYDPQPGTGTMLFVVRLVVAPAMAAALIAGFLAIRRRDIAAHREWMTRAYALGLGAGSQVFTQGLGVAFFGEGEVRSDLAKAAGWAINLAVAEWIIRRQPRHRQAIQVAPARPRGATP